MPLSSCASAHVGRHLAGALLALMLAMSCRPRGRESYHPEVTVHSATPALDSLDQALARWSRLGPRSYRYWLEESCFCPPAAPLDIVVRHGVVETSTSVPAESLPGRPGVTQGRVPQARTMDDMFREVRAGLGDTNWSVRVEYDSALGYPQWVTTGHRRITDVGYSLRVSHFTALRE